MITGKTRLLAIVGDPIDKARSPEGFGRLLEANGHDAIMIPVHVTAADLAPVLAGLKAIGNLDGIVATMPHKGALAAAADEVRETARLVGAANVLRRRPDGRWEADMFDGQGFVAGLRSHGLAAGGRRVALLGAGGAGSAIAVSLSREGIAAITVHDLDETKAERLVRLLRGAFARIEARVAAPDLAWCDLLVNATPNGMQPDDPLPWPLSGLRSGTIVGDVTTKPEVTPFVAAARAAGAPTVTGRDMFEGQIREMAAYFGYPTTRGPS
jgi:shikimate dehydrogenase